jgi:hypothetical protein
MSVLAFKKPEKADPHATGEAKCLDCGKRWAAVAPIGTRQLDCPDCGTNRGLWLYPFGADVGDLAFECICGNEVLTAFKRGGVFWLQCMACGTDQTNAVFGD